MAERMMSEEQIAELKQAFNEFDVDGGGNISTKELGWAMRAMGMNPTENDLLELINEYDTDGSGQIEFPEFCNMMSHKMNASDDKEAVTLAFRALDKDGSGTVETAEFKHLMTHVGDVLTEEEVMMLINAADKDGDGSLDFQEFVKIMM